jgi:hypothetical protein
VVRCRRELALESSAILNRIDHSYHALSSPRTQRPYRATGLGTRLSATPLSALPHD